MKYLLLQLAFKSRMINKRLLALGVASMLSLGVLTVFSAPAQAAEPVGCVSHTKYDYTIYIKHVFYAQCGKTERVLMKFAPMSPDSECVDLVPGQPYEANRAPAAKFTGADRC